jgi:hypothetical protein
LPSDYFDSVGTPEWPPLARWGFNFTAQYLAYTYPCQRFTAPLRTPMHDSEPVRIANPSPYETFIHNTLPVFTGAPKSEANAETNKS